MAKITGIVAAVALVGYIVYLWLDYRGRTPGDYLGKARAAESQSESEAIAAYEALIERFPSSDEAIHARQRINAMRQRMAAERRRNAALRVPDNTKSSRADIAYTHFRRAENVAKTGDLEHAIRIFRMVRDTFPDTPWGPRADARLQAAEEELAARQKNPPDPEP